MAMGTSIGNDATFEELVNDFSKIEDDPNKNLDDRKVEESTRSRVGIVADDGSVQSIYVHHDGYPKGVGAILDLHYTDEAKVKELMQLGDISSLGAEIGSKHDFKNAPEEETNAYGRDRGEGNVGSQVVKDHDSFIKLSHKTNANYAYLYTDGKWQEVLKSDRPEGYGREAEVEEAEVEEVKETKVVEALSPLGGTPFEQLVGKFSQVESDSNKNVDDGKEIVTLIQNVTPFEVVLESCQHALDEEEVVEEENAQHARAIKQVVDGWEDNFADRKFKNSVEVLDMLDSWMRDKAWGKKVYDLFIDDGGFRDKLEAAVTALVKKLGGLEEAVEEEVEEELDIAHSDKGKFYVVKGKKTVSGPYDTEEEAYRRIEKLEGGEKVTEDETTDEAAVADAHIAPEDQDEEIRTRNPLIKDEKCSKDKDKHDSVEEQDVEEGLLAHSNNVIFIEKEDIGEGWQVLRSSENSNTATVMFTFDTEEEASEAGEKIAAAIGGEFSGDRDPRDADKPNWPEEVPSDEDVEAERDSREDELEDEVKEEVVEEEDEVKEEVVEEGKWKLWYLSVSELKKALAAQNALMGIGLHDTKLMKELEDAIAKAEKAGVDEAAVEEEVVDEKLSVADVKGLFKSIDPAYAKMISGVYASKKQVANLGQLSGLKLSDEGKKILGGTEEVKEEVVKEEDEVKEEVVEEGNKKEITDELEKSLKRNRGVRRTGNKELEIATGAAKSIRVKVLGYAKESKEAS